MPLRPVGPDTFEVAAFPLRFAFREEDGVVKAEAQVIGEAYGSFVRVEVEPAPLDDYPGSYYSEEIGERYEVEVRDAALSIKRRKKDDAPMRPLGSDVFTTDDGLVFRFERDGQYGITGFRASTGRARRVLFSRLP
jgi:hypothetical protein